MYPIFLHILSSCCLIEIHVSESRESRVYSSASECKNLHVYFDQQWELVMFQLYIVSVVVDYIAAQKLKLNY